MKDLTSATWIKVKGILFLLLGIAAASLLCLKNPSWRVVGRLALAIWFRAVVVCQTPAPDAEGVKITLCKVLRWESLSRREDW